MAIRKFMCAADIEEAYEEGYLTRMIADVAIARFATEPPPMHVTIISPSKGSAKIEVTGKGELPIPDGKVPFLFAGDL